MASTLAAEVRVRIPPAVTCRPSPMEASALAVSTVTATAPATLTEPSDVEADGAVAPPVPVAEESCSLALVSANPSCVFVSLSTDWSVGPSWLPVSSSGSPPATLARASELTWETVRAAKVTAPPAVMPRAVVASDFSFATVSAMEMPTPCYPTWCRPPRWWLLRRPGRPLRPGFRSIVRATGSAARLAIASPLTREMAMMGVTAVWPFAPFFAWVVRVCEAVAVRARLFAPPSVVLVPSCACAVSVTILTATEAPMPKLEPPAPPDAGRAFAVLATVFVALSVTSRRRLPRGRRSPPGHRFPL